MKTETHQEYARRLVFEQLNLELKSGADLRDYDPKVVAKAVLYGNSTLENFTEDLESVIDYVKEWQAQVVVGSENFEENQKKEA